MVSVCKLGGTINQTGVKGGKSKRSKIPPQSLSFSFSPRPRFSWFAAHHSPLVRSRDVRSIALKTLGKERDCSQSTALWMPVWLSRALEINITVMYMQLYNQCSCILQILYVLGISTGLASCRLCPKNILYNYVLSQQ